MKPDFASMCVILKSDVSDLVREISEECGISTEDVIRHAIGLEKWFREARKNNNKIMIKRGGAWREVVD